MASEVIHYKDYLLPVGSYCQISEEGVPHNSMKARTRGAISLGPSENAHGWQKFYALDTDKVVVERQWLRLPMTGAVIIRINKLAVGQPTITTCLHGSKGTSDR